MTWLRITLLLMVLSGVEMYSRGAPNEACKTMSPKHGVPEQTAPSPYILTMSQVDYRPKENIIVTLSGGTTVKGFLIMPISAAPSDGEQVEPKIVGSLSSFAATTNICQNSALTHTSNDDKTHVTFTWTAPDSDMGPVVFKNTVVQDKKTFWTNQTSKKLTFNNGTFGDGKDGEWRLTDEEYEYYDEEWGDEDITDVDNSIPDVNENVTLPAVDVKITNDNTIPNIKDNVTLPSAADINVTNTNKWQIPDKVDEDIKKQTSDKANSGIPPSNSVKSISVSKTAKVRDTKLLSDTTPKSNTEDVQSIQRTGINGNVSNQLFHLGRIVVVNSIGLAMIAFV